jgi:hypothetical protein
LASPFHQHLSANIILQMGLLYTCTRYARARRLARLQRHFPTQVRLLISVRRLRNSDPLLRSNFPGSPFSGSQSAKESRVSAALVFPPFCSRLTRRNVRFVAEAVFRIFPLALLGLFVPGVSATTGDIGNARTIIGLIPFAKNLTNLANAMQRLRVLLCRGLGRITPHRK